MPKSQKSNKQKWKLKPLRNCKPPASRIPHQCQILAWDPGEQMGFAALSFGNLTHFYGGKELPPGLLRYLIDRTDLPTVGVIEEHVSHGKWGFQSYRRLQQRVGMAENELMSAGISRIVRMVPQTWRGPLGIKGNGPQCKAQAKALALALYGEKDELPDNLPLDVYEAACMATWGERAGQVGVLLEAA